MQSYFTWKISPIIPWESENRSACVWEKVPNFEFDYTTRIPLISWVVGVKKCGLYAPFYRMLHQIKAPQFYTDLDLQKHLNPPVNGKIQGLFKAYECFSSTFQGKFHFQGLSRQSCIFKYFSSLCEPWSSYSETRVKWPLSKRLKIGFQD